MRAIERAYQWAKGLSEAQKNEMLADLNTATATVINAFKDPSITPAQVEMLFKTADEGEVKKAALQNELNTKNEQLAKLQREIAELTAQIDVLNVVTVKQVDMRTQMADVRRRQIENMVAEGLKKQELQNAIKEKIADIPAEAVAEIMTEKPKRRKK
jgi:Asp-tRNA(Asn)/Glu-tRNA(Gln) amidotransferase C subunit